MANVKISELDDATTPLAGTELIEIVQSGSNHKVTIDDVLSGVEDLFLPSCFYPGIPGDGTVLLYIPVTEDVSFVADFVGSKAEVITAATAETIFTISKIISGTPTTIGTITFAISSTTGIFTTTGGVEQNLSAGDILKISNQATADATLADIGMTLKGVR